MRMIIAGLIALVAMLTPVIAKDTSVIQETNQRIKRFELFNDCRPITLLIEPLSDDAKKNGLTGGHLYRTAESRLRSARIYHDDLYLDGRFNEYLYVNVHVVGSAFSASLQYNRRVTNEHGHNGLAPTWNRSYVGSSASTSSVVSGLAVLMDLFLVEYLRVNEDACDE